MSPVATFGYTVAMAGDVDGDGFGDVLVGAPWEWGAAQNSGNTYLFYGGADPDTIAGAIAWSVATWARRPATAKSGAGKLRVRTASRRPWTAAVGGS